MFRFVQVVSVILVAVTMGLALAHALELPGKMRLNREIYLAVQPIYYPGFTIGGAVGELGGLIALIILLVLTSHGPPFWWTLAALAALFAAHLTYWLVTHPVNNFWLRDTELSGLGAAFFSLIGREGGADWSKLRDIWEYSHAVRAVLAMLSLIFLTLAMTG